MSNEFSLAVEARSDLGKGASRRLRRLENKVPGIIYGAGKEPQSICFLAKEINKAVENEAFYSHILTLSIDGKEEQVVLKDLQRHPAKNNVTHADFLRVDSTHKIQMVVPLHFINEDKCAGVKNEGGVIAHQVSEVLVSCLAQNLPEYIEVDMADATVGTTLHLSDIQVPQGVELVELSHGEDHNLPVVSVHTPKGGATTEDEEETTEE